jgi:hypothetical protein
MAEGVAAAMSPRVQRCRCRRNGNVTRTEPTRQANRLTLAINAAEMPTAREAVMSAARCCRPTREVHDETAACGQQV